MGRRGIGGGDDLGLRGRAMKDHKEQYDLSFFIKNCNSKVGRYLPYSVCIFYV